MFSLASFRYFAIFMSLITAFAVVTVDSAEARRGGAGLGSRGVKTFQSVPATKTSPAVTAPVQKPAANSTAQAQSRNATSTPGIFSGGLMRGLFLGGLFGLFLGTGFGGMAGMLSLLFQVALVGFVLWLLFGRRRMATAGGPASGGYGAAPQPSANPFSGAASAAATRPLEVTAADLDIFEERLGQLQDAYSREDDAALARLATPELRRQLSEELADLAEKGLRNEVYDVKMLSGSVAEAWSEGRKDFATVALRYESRDVLRERATGRLVSGSEALSEATEIWTFVRENGGDWRLSAMQDA
jgi:predicted lipid-binding transport protein (Tim44 family)